MSFDKHKERRDPSHDYSQLSDANSNDLVICGIKLTRLLIYLQDKKHDLFRGQIFGGFLEGNCYPKFPPVLKRSDFESSNVDCFFA